jgi:hypothetical protein
MSAPFLALLRKTKLFVAPAGNSVEYLKEKRSGAHRS